MPNHFSSIRLILTHSLFLFLTTLSIEIFRRARDFPMRARSLECRKNCFLGERLIYLISESLTWAWGLNSGRMLERNAFTNSTRWWVAVERCENSSRRKGEKGRDRKREDERKRKEGGRARVKSREREGAERESSRRRGLAIWFCNLDKESFLPRYWLLRVPTSSLLKLNGISQSLAGGSSPGIVSSAYNF